MVRFTFCALSVALATGLCMAEPTTLERAIHRFGEVDGIEEVDHMLDVTQSSTPAPTTTTTTTTHHMTPEEWMAAFFKALEKQLQMQAELMAKLIKDITDFFRNIAHPSPSPSPSPSPAPHFDGDSNSPLSALNEMLEVIRTRMSNAREGVSELMAQSETLEPETLRGVANKFMKEVRVQDVVVDALWASLRGMQTNAWVSGTTLTEGQDTTMVANKAAEEFLTRMYHNLRSAGISEEDIVKFVPKSGAEFETGMRNMGRRGHGYGYGYGHHGYGYGHHGYGYGYPSYGYGYPGYGYGYGYGYPSYGYGGWYSRYPRWGSGYGYGYRRLRPNMTTGVEGTNGMYNMMVPSFRAMGEQLNTTPSYTTGTFTGFNTEAMGFNTPMTTGYNTLYDTPLTGMGYNTEDVTNEYPMGFENTMGDAYNYETPMTTGNAFRGLAPINTEAGFYPETTTTRNTNYIR